MIVKALSTAVKYDPLVHGAVQIKRRRPQPKHKGRCAAFRASIEARGQDPDYITEAICSLEDNEPVAVVEVRQWLRRQKGEFEAERPVTLAQLFAGRGRSRGVTVTVVPVWLVRDTHVSNDPEVSKTQVVRTKQGGGGPTLEQEANEGAEQIVQGRVRQLWFILECKAIRS